MTIDIEQLRKDMEALNAPAAFDESARAYARLPDACDMASEYLAFRVAADALAEAVEIIGSPHVEFLGHKAREALAAYRKATG